VQTRLETFVHRQTEEKSFPVLVTVPPVVWRGPVCPGLPITVEELWLLRYAAVWRVLAYWRQTRFQSKLSWDQIPSPASIHARISEPLRLILVVG
jgi:hypothetical protein